MKTDNSTTAITILDEWRVIDRWWTDEPLDLSFVEVLWNGRPFIFVKNSHEKIWRILACQKN